MVRSRGEAGGSQRAPDRWESSQKEGPGWVESREKGGEEGRSSREDKDEGPLEETKMAARHWPRGPRTMRWHCMQDELDSPRWSL